MSVKRVSVAGKAEPVGSVPTVTLEGVSKAFGGWLVLDGVRTEFTAGVHAIIGPNGCGKTTLLAIMAGLLTPDRGRVTLDGVDIHADPMRAKSLTAYLPDEPCIYPFLTGMEFLNLVAGIRGMQNLSAAYEMLTIFGLHDFERMRFADMSLGTKRKFMLVSVFMHPCPLVLLDEPSNALAPEPRVCLVKILALLGTTRCVIMADHDYPLLEDVGARQWRFDAGKLVAAV